MNVDWLNLPCSLLVSPDFLGAEPVDRATWLCLMRFCAVQENGGVISDCGEWGDRKWQQLCGVTASEVNRTSALWSWSEGNLRVAYYFVEKEAEVQRLRGQASAAAHKRWKAERNAKRMPGGIGVGNAEGNRIEEKGREGEDETPTPPVSNGMGKAEAKKNLARLRLATDDIAIEEWIGFARDYAFEAGGDAALDCIEWCVAKARKLGRAVRFAREIEDLGAKYLLKQKSIGAVNEAV